MVKYCSEATDMLRTAGDSVGELVSTAGSVVRGVANSAASRLTGTARTIEQLTGLPLLRGLGLLAGGFGSCAPDANGGDLTAPTSDVGAYGNRTRATRDLRRPIRYLHRLPACHLLLRRLHRLALHLFLRHHRRLRQQHRARLR